MLKTIKLAFLKVFFMIPLIGVSLAATANDTCNFIQSVQQEEDPINISSADVKPTFKGKGMSEFTKWFGENIKYPDTSAKGTVILRFTIGSDGVLKDVKVVRSSGDKLLDAEALRVVGLSPKWGPAKKDDKAVAVFYMYPVKFEK